MEAVWVAILFIVSATAGDSISREKREGTLGLLFLTPLNAREIVMGKILLHAMRSAILLLSISPLLILPFMLGGITSGMLVEAFIFTFCLLILAIASGMVATVHNTEWMQSLVSSVLLCGLLWMVIMGVFRIYPLVVIVLSVAALLIAILHAGDRLEDSWQEEEAEKADPIWVRFFDMSDFFQTVFRWDTRKARDRNPIAWLQEYNWSSRLTKWGWCLLLFVSEAVIILGETTTLIFRQHVTYQMNLYRLTALGIAFTAAASFRRERQTGALELLLVTPISARQLIWGRLQGVWIHFFPPMAILATFWILSPEMLALPPRFAWYLAGAYFCIPVIGFFCSLMVGNILIAWALTVVAGLFLPYVITEQFRFEIGRYNIPFAYAAVQGVLAIVAGYFLYENLTHRRFALRRS